MLFIILHGKALFLSEANQVLISKNKMSTSKYLSSRILVLTKTLHIPYVLQMQ